MRFFMLALKDAGDDANQLIAKLHKDKDRFQDVLEFAKDRVWLVLAATPTVTATDITDLLAEEENDEDSVPAFFVAKVDGEAFNGYMDMGLWEKIDAWRSAAGPAS